MNLQGLTKLYYSIGEVSELFGVAPSLIRYWESEFKTLSPSKNSRGDRKYTLKDIDHIKTIYHLLKEKGFTIEGAKKELSIQKQTSKSQSELLKNLKDIKKKILDFRNSLE
ncbi:MAG: MerR family transcriptional regulator [Saprospiraceae bacterium]|nr:MerR family transcriptional regulator [Saprospiraceae bacterium]